MDWFGAGITVRIADPLAPNFFSIMSVMKSKLKIYITSWLLPQNHADTMIIQF